MLFCVSAAPLTHIPQKMCHVFCVSTALLTRHIFCGKMLGLWCQENSDDTYSAKNVSCFFCGSTALLTHIQRKNYHVFGEIYEHLPPDKQDLEPLHVLSL